MKKILSSLVVILILTTMIASCSKDGAGNYAAAPDNNSGNGKSGSMARFTMVGNYLYIVDLSSLKAYDCSDPENPKLSGSTYLSWNIETIYPYQDKLFIGSSNGMYVFSLEDPANPKMEGSVSHVRACDPVIGNDTVAYVTLRSFGNNCGSTTNVLNVYNIKNSAQPVLVNTIEMASPYGLGMSDTALYVCDGTSGLKVYNIANAWQPELVKTISGFDFQDVIPYGDILISHIADGFHFFDISDPLEPVETGVVND
ncbi:LVIVD repeat-containing protein [Flavihumibacter petaseus]|uniref:LVIVD repeat-containing protein n=1 Tax=Flavihumibacter petaseus NBRC 106054 TaxID=1220578 RepID=A0A0E9MU24_9BACT|nr:hypothetical protein [Flavihumibacter petaseus]GAO41069.1 hypothetical protein FPE01S_01_00810 [Flavihumibacter petaseus NBRC 106054]